MESDVVAGEVDGSAGDGAAGVTEGTGVVVSAGGFVAHPAARIARTQARKSTGTTYLIRRITQQGLIKQSEE